jgi:hypothetical protein
MVQAVIDISEQTNQILNIVKAKYNLKNKSEAIERVVFDYGSDMMEPELRPEFIERMRRRQKEPTVRVTDFRKHFNLD